MLSAFHRVIRDDAVIKMPPLEQMAALFTRNEFYLPVKFVIILPFTMILSGPSPTKNSRLRIYQDQRRLFCFIYSMPLVMEAVHCPLITNEATELRSEVDSAAEL